jgi:signal transduction histidine kinase
MNDLITKKTATELESKPVKAPSLKLRLSQCEAERKKLGRELHDGLGQSLTALKLMIDITAASPKQDARLIEEMRVLVHKALVDVRTFCNNLESTVKNTAAESGK